MKYAILIPAARKDAVTTAMGVGEPSAWGTSSVTHYLLNCATGRNGINAACDLAASEPTVTVWLKGENEIFIHSKLGGNVKAWPDMPLATHLNREFNINRGTA